jgi:hypothetical protein
MIVLLDRGFSNVSHHTHALTAAVQDRDGAKPALLQAYTLSVRNARTTRGRRSRTD